MIGKNWMKSLALASVVAVALPLASDAATRYTGKTPASITMMSTSAVNPVKKVATRHKLKHHVAVKKAVVHSKHKKLTVTAKKKHTV